MNTARIFVPKLYLNQHRVLEKIYNVPSVHNFPNLEELSASLQLDEDEVTQAAYLLKGRGFAFVQKDKRPFIIGCTPEGGQALLQRILLEEGREKRRSGFLRGTQIFGIIIASAISVSTFIINALATAKNSSEIKEMRVELASLKEAQKVTRSN